MTAKVIRGPWRALPRRKGWPPPAAYLEARKRLGLTQSCGDGDDIYDSPFRRANRLRPRHQCQLRELAAEQAHQAAKVTQHPAITSPAALSAIAAIEIPPWPCPGEYGPGGTWQEHCKSTARAAAKGMTSEQLLRHEADARSS